MKTVNRPSSNKTQVPVALMDEDTAVLAAIRKITSKGNDAEVKLKPDGKLRVYEIKRTSYP